MKNLLLPCKYHPWLVIAGQGLGWDGPLHTQTSESRPHSLPWSSAYIVGCQLSMCQSWTAAHPLRSLTYIYPRKAVLSTPSKTPHPVWRRGMQSLLKPPDTSKASCWFHWCLWPEWTQSQSRIWSILANCIRTSDIRSFPESHTPRPSSPVALTYPSLIRWDGRDPSKIRWAIEFAKLMPHQWVRNVPMKE